MIELPYTEKQFDEKLVAVTNKGEVQIVGKLFGDQKAKDRKSKIEAGYKYIIRTYSPTNTEGKEYIVDLGGKFIEQIFIRTRPDNGNVVIAGMYSNEHNNSLFRASGVLHGFFYLEIAPDGKVANKYIKDLNASKIKNISAELLNEKQNGLSPNVDVIDVFFKKDGSLIVVTEDSYFTQTTSPNSGRTRTTYHNNDNIIICLDPKGDIKWTVSVPKKQIGRESKVALGASAIFKDDNLFLIYNDSAANLEKEPDGRPKGLGLFGKSVVTLALVSPDGKLTRKALATTKEIEGFIFAPLLSERLTDDELVFVSVRLGLVGVSKYKLARIKIGA